MNRLSTRYKFLQEIEGWNFQNYPLELLMYSDWTWKIPSNETGFSHQLLFLISEHLLFLKVELIWIGKLMFLEIGTHLYDPIFEIGPIFLPSWYISHDWALRLSGIRKQKWIIHLGFWQIRVVSIFASIFPTTLGHYENRISRYFSRFE